MNTTGHPVEVIESKCWPGISAEIFRERLSNGATVWRTKCGSAAYPELVTQKIFETREQAVAHANIVLGH